MRATRVYRERKVVADDAFVEIVIWHVPKPVLGSSHEYKYSLVLVIRDECVLRYDNERSKGDHRHWHEHEADYEFRGLSNLLADFWRDVEAHLK